MKGCDIEGCDRRFYARRWCKLHYYRWKRAGDPNTLKIEIHGLRNHPMYHIWKNLRQRCNNASNRDYKYYGGRGIKVCASWNQSFVSFLNDMGERPGALSIDRIDNDGDYEPSNCHWATHQEQALNRRARKG